MAERVSADEAVAAKSAAEADAIKQKCQAALDEAIPMKEAAEKALNAITKKDITELKTVKEFHPDVTMVMSAVCILMNEQPAKKLDPTTQKKVTDFVTPSKALMAKSDFLKLLLEYPSEDVEEKHIKGIAPFTSNEKFNKDHLLKINMVAANMASWVLAM